MLKQYEINFFKKIDKEFIEINKKYKQNMYLRVLKKDNLYYPQYWQEVEWVYDEVTKLSGTRIPHWKNFEVAPNDEIYYIEEERAINFCKRHEEKEKEETFKKFGEVVWKNKAYESIG